MTFSQVLEPSDATSRGDDLDVRDIADDFKVHRVERSLSRQYSAAVYSAGLTRELWRGRRQSPTDLRRIAAIDPDEGDDQTAVKKTPAKTGPE